MPLDSKFYGKQNELTREFYSSASANSASKFYGKQNEQKREFYSSASAYPDSIFYGKQDEKRQIYGNDQIKKEPNESYSSMSSKSDDNFVDLTDSIIDYDEFIQKAECDVKNFIPSSDQELPYKELKSKYPHVIKDIESNLINQLPSVL